MPNHLDSRLADALCSSRRTASTTTDSTAARTNQRSDCLHQQDRGKVSLRWLPVSVAESNLNLPEECQGKGLHAMQRLPATAVEQQIESLDPHQRAAARENWQYLYDPSLGFRDFWLIVRHLLRLG